MYYIYTDNSKEIYDFLLHMGYKGIRFSKHYKFILVLHSNEINQVEYYKNETNWYIKDAYPEYKYIKPEGFKRIINEEKRKTID